MSTLGVPGPVVRTLHAACRAGDRSRAARACTRLIDEGVPLDDVVSALAELGQGVGDDWHRAAITHADEHIATGVIQHALAEACSAAGVAAAPGAEVVVACAEGDWHGMAAEMMAARLRAAGWLAHAPGPALPVEQLAAELDRPGVTAVVVTCSMPAALTGATRTVATAHAAGLPALVGGRAVTPYGLGLRLGADGPAYDAGSMLTTLRRWVTDRPVQHAQPLLRGQADVLTAGAAGLDERAAVLLAQAGLDGERVSADELRWVLEHMQASVLVDSAALWQDFRRWFGGYLTSRRRPVWLLDAAVDALRQAGAGEHDAVLEANVIA